MTATPPKPNLLKTTALVQGTLANSRLTALMPTVPSKYSPVTVYQAGTPGVGAQLSAPTSVFPAGSGYYGVWTAPDLNSGKPYTVQVECFGGGGGGGGGSATTGGGGGGGAEYACEPFYPVQPGKSYAWVVGVPGSAGTANNNGNQAATAGGAGGLTVFDIAGTGVAGGVVAHGGAGGDAGNTGLGGDGGSGSANTVAYAGGAGGTDLPGTGGGTGGQGGTDNPVSLYTAGLLSQTPVAWYILNDASSNGQVNDDSGNGNQASLSGPGGNTIAFGQPGASPQVPAYAAAPNAPSAPNPTTVSTRAQFPLTSLTTSAGCILTPGIYFQGRAVTISGWVTCDPSGTWGNTAAGSRAVIAANTSGYTGGSDAGGALYLRNTGSRANPSWTLNWYCGNDATSLTISTALPAVPGTAYYVVGVFDDGAMTLYVNGTSVATGSAGFSSLPGGDYSMTLGLSPLQSSDWFFGFMSNVWIANGALSAGGVTQAYSGSGSGTSTEGGAGGGASGGPAAAGGAGAAGSGSSGGAGGTAATQPAADIGLNTPASAGIAGAAGGSGNSGITGAPGAGGGGAGSSLSTPPDIVTITVPFVTAASYCGTDALGSASAGPLTGSVTSPAASADISPVITFTQAGTYTGYWTVTLAGTVGTADADNFAVMLNSAARVAASVNAGATGAYAQVPFTVTVNAGDTIAVASVGTATTGALYEATLSVVGGGAAGSVYNPVIQGTTGRLFTGGQASDVASGSKNSLLIVPPGLAASLRNGSYVVTRVTLTVSNANPLAAQAALLQVGWSGDTFLPLVYGGGDIAGSAGVVEIPAGSATVTADLTESQIGAYLQNGSATALVLGPGFTPGAAAYSAATAADFYTAVYGPGATDSAGNSLAPYLTITYAQSTTVQQGSPGGAGGIRVTYLNQGESLVGSWNATSGISAQGGQLTETSVVLGSAGVTDGGHLAATLSELSALGLSEEQATAVRAAVRRLSARLGAGIAGAPGIIAGYQAGTASVTQSVPGTYTFTVPAGVTSLNVQCWGAGAGATGGSTSTGQGAGGGGAYAGEPNYAVTPGQVLSYTVGAGGTGDHVGSSSSPDGGATIFDSGHVAGNGVTANGGLSYRNSRNYGPGGTTAGNTVAFAGGNGGPLQYGQVNGSGGGGSAGAEGNGGNGNQGGGAGSAGAGGGAAGGNGSGNGSGSTGSAPGAGGGGASRGTTAFTGGSGGAGQVVITYASSTALSTSIATAAGTDGAGNPYPTGVMTNAMQVNGTTTTQNTTVSGTTTTNTLTVSANASVGGNHTVTGNVAVGGTIAGPSGGTLEASSGIHSAGTVQADIGVNAPTVQATTQLLVGGASGASALEVNGNVNAAGEVISAANTVVGGQLLVGGASGGSAVEVNGVVNASGGFVTGANINASGTISASNYISGQGNPGQLDGNTATISQICSFANAIVNALHDAGVMV